MSKRKSIDPELDKLYARKIKCPYCKTPIKKFTKTCTQCGVTKDQIFEGSNLEAKAIIEGKAPKAKVLMVRRRPSDIDFTRLILLAVFGGLFGAHCFYVGRRKRGYFMMISFFVFILSAIIFSHGTPDASFEDLHPWRRAFDNVNLWFPLDVPGLIVIGMWFVDWFAIVVFQRFKYPVRLPRQKD